MDYMDMLEMGESYNPELNEECLYLKMEVALVPKTVAGGAQATVPLVHADGSYDIVPLAKDTVSLAVMQTRVRPVDAANPEKGRRENLAHMLDLIDGVQTGVPKDLLFFHEFPITGFRFEWTREEALRVAIEIPGPETEEISKAARKYKCYIVFGSYVRDADWPDTCSRLPP